MPPSLKKGPGVCPVCKEYVPLDDKRPDALHICSGEPLPTLPVTAVKWGLKRLGKPDLNQYAFPDLAEIVQQLGVYVQALNAKPPRPANVPAPAVPVTWPALSLTLKVGKQITEPGMVLMLGNPVDANGSIACDVMNGLLPGVSYQTIHQQWIADPSFDGKFRFTTQTQATEFFQKTGAIAIMPSDAAWAGNAPATQLTHGGVMVNAHSNCAPGLMVHEIVHCYGGPAGFVGEGLTDWFAIDFMKSWNKSYDGNPAYAYQTSLVDRLVRIAGKERVARLAFADPGAVRALKVTPAGKKFPVSGGSIYTSQQQLGDKAFDARAATMQALGLGDDVVPRPAADSDEQTAGVPGLITKLGELLVTLMPL
ncbi:MAG: hypothetical protein IT531_10785 [Burkholderiales bacterium]|nr:hypothetical protein [Burkholderiales bacterium]